MALEWGLDKIKDFEQVCWQKAFNAEGNSILNDKGEQKLELKPATEALIWILATVIGITKLTKVNVLAAYSRYCFHLQLSRNPMVVYGHIKRNGKRVYRERPVTLAEFRAHIGLWTNGVSMTVAEFKRNQLKAVIEMALCMQKEGELQPTKPNWKEGAWKPF